ncbi:MAG: Crp/Fnr family transcriptional regulator [Methylibium sp.]|nr:Crp/Fnr family transcriptional regulator [Methylibium sp.]
MAANENHLIEWLPRAARQALLALCEPVELALSNTLGESSQPAPQVYFPVDGFVSLLTVVDRHPGLETAMVGREGMLGHELALGRAPPAQRVLVQSGGRAWRISGPDFVRLLGDDAALRHCVDRYLCTQLTQLAIASACLRFHRIGPRLARWLLMGQDRAQADSFHVTHELLAQMLGVRRVGITTAAGALQRAGMIEYHRGMLRVCDRSGLELSACSCYAADQQVYQRLLG